MCKEKLVLVWLSADKRAAMDMAMLYARDAMLNRWFKCVKFYIWGPTVELAAVDLDIQTELMLMKRVGVDVAACMACASSYGVVSELRDLGITVRGLGEELSHELACGSPVMVI